MWSNSHCNDMRKHPFFAGFVAIFSLGIVFCVCLWVLSRSGLLKGIEIGTGDNIIVVLDIEGVILKSRPIIEKLNRYKDNDKVKAVVVRIDSPGGGVGSSQEIYEEVIKLGKKKTVVASMGAVAASGGYYIACAAQKIVANPGTITGSIGVIIEFANIEELLGKIGLKSIVIKSGKFKDILSPTRNLTEEERGLLQGVIDSIQSQFIEAVVQGRNIPREKVAKIADGRIFSGEQAMHEGLVDELGNLQDAIEIASKMAGIIGRPDVVYPEKKKPSILEFIIESCLTKVQNLVTENSFKVNFLYQN